MANQYCMSQADLIVVADSKEYTEVSLKKKKIVNLLHIPPL